jgi:hypothetical protein
LGAQFGPMHVDQQLFDARGIFPEKNVYFPWFFALSGFT